MPNTLSNLIEICTRRETSKALFKVSAALVTAYLLSIVHVANYITPLEVSSYEMKAIVEKESGKEFDGFQNMNCKLSLKSYKECKMAKHKNEIVVSAAQAASLLREILKWLIILCSSTALIGFLSTISSEKHNKFKNGKRQQAGSDAA